MKKFDMDLEALLRVIMHADIIHTQLVGENLGGVLKTAGIADYTAGKIYLESRLRGNVREYMDSCLHEAAHMYQHIMGLGLTEEDIQKFTKRKMVEIYDAKYNIKKTK